MEEDKAEAVPLNKEVDGNKAEEMEEDKKPDEKTNPEEDKKPEGTRRVSTSEEPKKNDATDAISSLLALSKHA